MNTNTTEKILVTGGAGYIGSAIVMQLVEAGYDVVVIDDLSAGQKDKVNAKTELIEVDITDKDALDVVFSNHNFSTVIHCAGKKVIKESESDPTKYFQNNVGGTLNILAAMEKYKVPKIIFSSTAAVYSPTLDDSPVNELSPVEPTNVYGQSKLMAETLIKEYARLNKISSYVIFRYFTVAGDVGLRYQEGDGWQGVFTLIAKSYMNDVQFYITGTDYKTKDGSGVRDYIHLSDLASAHLKALDFEGGDTFNLGTSFGFTCRELVVAFESEVGRSLNAAEAERRPGDVAVMLADATRVREMLGWKPEKTLEDMVKSVVDVYEL